MGTRREKIVLELEDDLSPGLLRVAAAARLVDAELNKIGKSGTVVNRRLDGMSGRIEKTGASLKGMNAELGRSNKGLDVFAGTGLSRTAVSANRADQSINQLTGRLRLFADAAAIFGPGAVPVGGVLAGGVAGFASQLGFAAIAGGVLVGSMQGLGDTLSALNDAQLEPTADNLRKAEDALNALSPAAARFAEEAYALAPLLRGIRDAGAEGLFPGLTDSLDDLERLAPVVARIFESVGSAVGDIAADGAASLASDRWAGFFDFIATEAPRALSEMASAIGDVTHGLAELWMAFTPLNNSFSGWLMDVADGFDSWASGLSQTDGFREFVDYIRETGPQVADTFGSLVGLVVQLVQAAAPLGGPVLQALEGIADAAAAIADSGLGTLLLSAAAGMAAFSRASKGLQAVGGSRMFAPMTADLKNMVGALDSTARSSQRASMSVGAFAAADRDRLATLGKSTAAIAGLTLATTGAADGMGISNTASLALMGTLAGPWGAAAGASVGLLMDMKAAANQATTGFHGLDDAIDSANIAELTQRIAEAKAEMADQDSVTGFGDFFSDAFRDIGASGSGSAMKAYTDEIDRAEKELIELKNARADAAADSSLYNSIQAESDALEKNIGLMQAKRDAALRGFSAQTDYSQSLLDAKKALEENGRAWGLNSEAGLKNRRVVEQQAASWNQLNREQGQTPAQARKARAALEDTAISLGATKEEARRYARQLMDIPNQLETKIGLDVDTAMQRAKAIKSELASIDRNIDVYVNVRRPNAGGFGPQATSSADGSTVPKTGKPYADRHLYLLADGEEVISNRHGQADRWRPLLKDINANRLADGGTADGKKRSRKRFDFSSDTSALEAAIERLTGVAANQTAAIEAQKSALEKATETTEMWAGKMSDVARATTAGFSTGLFERDSNPWAAGSGGGPLANLTRDISGLEERGALQQQLAGLGISGDALAAILGEGTNADIAGIIANGTAASIAAAFNQRAALQDSVGAAGGQAAYGAQSAAAEQARLREFAELQAQSNVLRGIESRMGNMEAQIAQLNADGPERTGVAAGAAMRGYGDEAARRRPRWQGVNA